jgi:hypothetical protein
MLRHKPTHKGFKRKSFSEMLDARKRFQSAKSELRKQKDIWNAEWKKDHADIKFCWSCGKSGGPNPGDVITQMHGLKQRFATTRETCRFAAWVCWGEHRPYDEAQGIDVHQKMADFVRGLIAKIQSRSRDRDGALTQ